MTPHQDAPYRSPLAQIDRVLVSARWAIILIVGLPLLFEPFQAGMSLSPPTVLLAITAVNLPISIYAWQRRPLANGRIRWLLLSDLLQFPLAIAFSGGYRSLFFALAFLIMAETAQSFRWQAALAWAATIGALQVAASLFPTPPVWGALAATMIAGKLIISLLVGGLVILFSELLRREEKLRREMTRTAARTAALNALFMRLGESVLNLEQALAAILNGAQTVPDVFFSLVLLPEEGNGCWRVAAASSSHHPIGKIISDLGWSPDETTFFACGVDERHPLPPFTAGDAINRLSGVFLRSPDGEALGALLLGRRSSQPLDDSDQLFLQSLALEAGLALRNARLFAQEQAQVAQLQRFESLQSTFFSAISHELKTPLAVLKMLLPSFPQWPDLPAAAQSEMVETVTHNLARLETLITDLLESARLEAGAIALHRQAVDVSRLIGRVREDLTPLLARKKQQLAITLPPELPPVWADGRRVGQILSNLLGNAAKYGPPESEIGLETAVNNHTLQITISDAGPGVPPAERERIFDRFYIALGNKTLGGAGLGLFICRELVRLHGGQIWVEERPGGGSRFCFTLPLADEEE